MSTLTFNCPRLILIYFKSAVIFSNTVINMNHSVVHTTSIAVLIRIVPANINAIFLSKIQFICIIWNQGELKARKCLNSFLDMFKRNIENDEGQDCNDNVGDNQKLNKTFILKYYVKCAYDMQHIVYILNDPWKVRYLARLIFLD